MTIKAIVDKTVTDGTNINKPVDGGQPLPEKKKPRPMDKTLRLVRQLDNIMAAVPEPLRAWVMTYLNSKYGAKP